MSTELHTPPQAPRDLPASPADQYAMPVARADVPAKSGMATLVKYLVWAALAVGGYFAYPHVMNWWKGGAPTNDRPSGPRAIPVGTATTRRGEMEIYLTGLGTVTPLTTVTVRSRVEGELIKVAFNEGDLVEEGQVLAEIDPRPYKIQLELATAQRDKDAATLENTRLILQRNEGLIKSNAISKQEYETQISLVKEQEAIVKSDQARMGEAQLNITFCTIRAPTAGRIGLRTVDQGNLIRANEATGMAVITLLHPITVVFAIPQDSVVAVQKRINAGEKLAVDAYNRGFTTKLDAGTLLALDNQVDPTTGTVKLKGYFENKDRLLYPNQFVNVRLLLETRRNVILIPAAAIQTGPQSEFVYVVKPDETVELRRIKSGPREAETAIVEEGLTAGEIVVVDGVDKLTAGAKVITRKPNAEANKAAPRATTKGGA